MTHQPKLVDAMPEQTLVERLRTAHEWCSGYEPSWSCLLRDADEAAERIERLEAKVEIAAAIFEEYARLHREKGTVVGNRKAERNERYAAEMRAALSASNEGE